jgi:oligosaccharide translocation protein RFT1
MVELFAEPSFVAAQQKMLYKVRASAEAAATIMKTFATVGLVVWASRQGKDLGVLPFAVGQLAYAVSLLVVYTARLVLVARSEGFSLLPRGIQRFVISSRKKKSTMRKLTCITAKPKSSGFLSSHNLCSISR